MPIKVVRFNLEYLYVRFKAARLNRGLTQAELSSLIRQHLGADIPQSQLSRLEQKHSAPAELVVLLLLFYHIAFGYGFEFFLMTSDVADPSGSVPKTVDREKEQMQKALAKIASITSKFPINSAE